MYSRSGLEVPKRKIDMIVEVIDIIVVIKKLPKEFNEIEEYQTGKIIATGATKSIFFTVIWKKVCIGNSSFNFSTTKRAANAAREHIIEMIIVLCGSKPIFKLMYDSGRFSSRIPLTTI